MCKENKQKLIFAKNNKNIEEYLGKERVINLEGGLHAQQSEAQCLAILVPLYILV